MKKPWQHFAKLIFSHNDCTCTVLIILNFVSRQIQIILFLIKIHDDSICDFILSSLVIEMRINDTIAEKVRVVENTSFVRVGDDVRSNIE